MATSTALRELKKQGQSLWLDNIRRQLISSGEPRALKSSKL